VKDSSSRAPAPAWPTSWLDQKPVHAVARVTHHRYAVGDSTQAGADPLTQAWKETQGQMPMLAEEVDAVIGGDTHRDSHALEMAAPTGATISTLEIGNDPTGFAEAVGWITQSGIRSFS